MTCNQWIQDYFPEILELNSNQDAEDSYFQQSQEQYKQINPLFLLDTYPGNEEFNIRSNLQSLEYNLETITQRMNKKKAQMQGKIKKWQMFPKETKNMSKNLTRALKHFIKTHFSESNCLQNAEIKKFLSTQPQNACKQTLENSINSCKQLKQISKIFFGQLSWATAFLEDNKVEIEHYIRFNNLWFPEKKN